MRKINTYVITGFLGAGKTTILNHILKQVSNQKNVIVENEFGKVNIDKQLVEQKYDELYELTNGCICCTHDEALFDLLNDLYVRRNEVDNLFIETTGIADVSPIIALFNREDVQKTFCLKSTICIVDAEVLEDFLSEIQEIEKQLVCSDVVIINKANHVHQTYLDHLTQMLHSINPLATIYNSADGFIHIEQLNIKRNNFTIPVLNGKQNRHSKFVTLLFETEKAIDLLKFRHTMTVTMLLYNKQIYRSKGFVKTNDGDVYLFQSAGRTISITKSTNKEIKKTQLVFIGKNVEYQAVERIIKQTLYKQSKIKQL